MRTARDGCKAKWRSGEAREHRLEEERESDSFWLWQTELQLLAMEDNRQGGRRRRCDNSAGARAPVGGARVRHPGGRHRTGGRARRGTRGDPEAAAIWLDERNE